MRLTRLILTNLLLCLLSSMTLAQSPVLLRDFKTSGASSFPSDPLFKGISANNLTFFLAETPEHGEELYRSNGTEVGTVLLKDINPGETGSGIRFLPQQPSPICSERWGSWLRTVDYPRNSL